MLRLAGKWLPVLGLGAALTAGLGCTGKVGDGGEPGATGPGGNKPGASQPGGSGPGGGTMVPGGSAPGPGVTPGNLPPPAGNEIPGPAATRRLTRLEYNNTIRDLLGDASAPASRFPPDQVSGGFSKGGAVAEVDAGVLLETAQALSAAAVARLPSLLPCKAIPAAGAEQDECAEAFIDQFGKRAFRRPLDAAEKTALLALYRKQRDPAIGHDFPNAVRVLIQGMLLSPSFLYRRELGSQNPLREGNLIRFNGYEIASRLSYFLWASMPDDDLFAAADKDQLSTPAQVEQQARRMLKDGKASEAIADFHLQWLGLSQMLDVQKDTVVYPTFSADLMKSMMAETRAFVAQIFGPTGDGKLDSLLTSRSSFVDENLAKLYKVAGITGKDMRPTMLDEKRAGILTQGSFLAVQANTYETHPIKRGVEILEQLLCQHLPEPPPDVPEPKQAKDGVSTRERYAEHGSNACAKACHEKMDPLGFAFEHYDGIGAYREMDWGKPVDASGEVTLASGKKSWKNGVELVKILAGEKEVQECLAIHWTRYMLRRNETSGEAPAVSAAHAAFAQSGYDLRELLVGIARTRAFSHRTPSEGEVLQ